MKIKQEEDFKPITLTLETKEEALIFWELMQFKAAGKQSSDQMAVEISNWFSLSAHL